jgi:hypothetical protein
MKFLYVGRLVSRTAFAVEDAEEVRGGIALDVRKPVLSGGGEVLISMVAVIMI